jgi:hypothetical protein
MQSGILATSFELAIRECLSVGPRGERQISSLEGIAANPKFTADGKKLCYTIVKEAPTPYSPQTGEVWVADVESGRSESLVSGFRALDYDVSPDGQQVVMEAADAERKHRLWLVPFALWGRAGVIAFMTVVSLAIVANVYWLNRELEVRRRIAIGVAVAFGLGTPVLMYASLSFVEPLGALVCVYALRVLHARALRPRDLALVSAALGALPWIHSRFLLFPPIFGVFLLVRVWREGRSPARLVCLLGPAAVLVGALLVYNAVMWHTFGLAPNQVNAGAVHWSSAWLVLS